jgi:integrase
LAGTTGIRKNELLSLVWSDINLSDSEPFVRVRAGIAKNGKETLQPLTTMSARLLASLKACIRPKDTDRVFLAFNKSINTAELIRSDLEAAEIPPRDKDGNEIVFHSLRNSFISFLANSQTPAKVIQKMARHSDPKLTFNTYARVLPEAERKAISFLPNFGDFVLSTSLDKTCIKQEIFRDNHRHKNSQDALKTAFLAAKELRAIGVEPTRP